MLFLIEPIQREKKAVKPWKFIRWTYTCSMTYYAFFVQFRCFKIKDKFLISIRLNLKLWISNAFRNNRGCIEVERLQSYSFNENRHCPVRWPVTVRLSLPPSHCSTSLERKASFKWEREREKKRMKPRMGKKDSEPQYVIIRSCGRIPGALADRFSRWWRETPTLEIIN